MQARRMPRPASGLPAATPSSSKAVRLACSISHARQHPCMVRFFAPTEANRLLLSKQVLLIHLEQKQVSFLHACAGAPTGMRRRCASTALRSLPPSWAASSCLASIAHHAPARKPSIIPSSRLPICLIRSFARPRLARRLTAGTHSTTPTCCGKPWRMRAGKALCSQSEP
jgi:hypothetical protein